MITCGLAVADEHENAPCMMVPPDVIGTSSMVVPVTLSVALGSLASYCSLQYKYHSRLGQ